MSLLKDIWNAVSGVGKGMTKTYDEQFDPVFTEMYPFEMPKLPPVSVQSLALIKNEDGSDRCVSCLACEKVCPSQVITIERKKNPAGKGFVLERFDIDLVNCMYCAACVEACPASAIVTIQDFEMSTPNLQTLKADKEFLDLQGMRAQQWYSPKIGVEYRENVTAENLHGTIVKAPLLDQPGGLAEIEKLKAANEEIPAGHRARPAVAMSELPVAIFQELKHEPISAPAALEPIKAAPVIPTASVVPAAPVVASVAMPVPAEGAPARSKKIKRWGEPKAEEAAEAASAVVSSAETTAVAEPASGEAAAKPRSSKIKRWEPK
ncbi:MAG: 4Fe-4S dicluster domain-containing protein [Deinococcales bacterium]